jgi:hypothetical protein
LLPLALLALLAGFSGQIRAAHALMLAVQGLVIFAAWPESTDARSFAGAGGRAGGRRGVEVLLAIVLAVLAGWGGVRAARDISDALGLSTRLPITAWLAAPALTLPMIGSGMLLARRGGIESVVSTSVNLVVLNLCVAVPLLVVVWTYAPHARHVAAVLPTASSIVPDTELLTQSGSAAPATGPTMGPATSVDSSPALPYPISLWRVDTVLLILIGLFLLPAAFARWSLRRGDGVFLVAVYLAYMWLTAWLGRSG